MKILLLTYFASDNYGAVLQTYATIKVLEQQGHEVQLANYIIPEPRHSWAKVVLLYPKHLKFERFRRKWFCNISRPYRTFEDLQVDPPVADCYLVGSDQTWNPFISKEKSKGFFLDFGDDNAFRASYAASFGLSEWMDSKWICFDEAKQFLERFNLVSVRESSGLFLLREKFEIKNVSQVIDPVLMFCHYDELTGSIIQGDELILYKLVNSVNFYQRALQISKCLECSVRSIGSIRIIKGVSCSYPESIEGWIRRIASARYVITDSFHGTVISLLYHRQFVVCVGNPELVTRIQSLLSLLGLEDRLFYDDESVDNMIRCLDTPINYDVIDEKLQSLRKESITYLVQLDSNRLRS